MSRILGATRPGLALVLALAGGASGCGDDRKAAGGCDVAFAFLSPRPGARILDSLSVVLREPACIDTTQPVTARVRDVQGELVRTEEGTFAGTLDTGALADGPATVVASAANRRGQRQEGSVIIELVNGYRIIGSSSTDTVVAGESVTVTCALLRGDDTEVEDESFTIVVDPPTAIASQTGNSVTLTPTVSGDVTVSCLTADGLIAQDLAASVKVEPAAAALVETFTDDTLVMAGDAAQVTCEQWDRFGNAIVEPSTPPSEIDSSLTSAAVGDGTHAVTGTAPGVYEVACRVGTVQDATPVLITLVAAEADSVETSLPSSGTAGEVTEVTCSAFDRFGNEVLGAELSFAVAHVDGHAPGMTGLELLADSRFVVTLPGDYEVACLLGDNTIADATPGLITVDPGLPATLSASLSGLECRGSLLSVSVEASDAWDNPIAQPRFRLVPPADDLINDNGDGTFWITKAVPFVLSVEIVGPTHSGLGVTPALLAVDPDTIAPVLTISEPVRAAVVTSADDADAPIPVSGVVSDDRGSVALMVNGATVVPAAGETAFATTIDTRWGISIAEAVATDPCGNETRRVGSILRSSTFYPAVIGPELTAAAPQGFILHFNDEGIDDGNRGDGNDDLATILEGAVTSLDVNSLLEASYSDGSRACNFQCGCALCVCPTCDSWTVDLVFSASLDEAATRITGPSVTGLRAVDGGLELSWGASDASVRYSVTTARVENCTCGVRTTLWSGSGSITASVGSVGSTTVVGIAMQNGVPTATHHSTSSSVSSASVSCSGIDSRICNAIKGTIGTAVQTGLDSAADTVGPTFIRPAVQSFLDSLAFDDTVVAGPPVDSTLNTRAVVDATTLCGANVGLSASPGCPVPSPAAGLMQIGFATQVYPDEKNPALPEGTLGPVRLPAAAPLVTPVSPQTGGMARADEVMNQAMWSLWYSGGLSDKTILPDPANPDIAFVISTLLPPVFMPGRSGYDLDLGMGDVRADVVFSGEVVAVLYASSVIGVDVTVTGPNNTIEMTPEPTPLVHTEIASSQLPPSADRMLMRLVQTFARDGLATLLGDILSTTALPEIPLDSIPGNAPGETMQLTSTTAVHADGYLRATGVFE